MTTDPTPQEFRAALHDMIANGSDPAPEDWTAERMKHYDRLLARVRRDAAREALDGLIDAWLGKYGTPETRDAGIAVRDYRETNYRLPEETPND